MQGRDEGTVPGIFWKCVVELGTFMGWGATILCVLSLKHTLIHTHPDPPWLNCHICLYRRNVLNSSQVPPNMWGHLQRKVEWQVGWPLPCPTLSHLLTEAALLLTILGGLAWCQVPLRVQLRPLARRTSLSWSPGAAPPWFGAGC